MSPNPKLSRFNSVNVSPNVPLDQQPSIVKDLISVFETNQIEEVASPADPHVKVIARIRPPNSHEREDYTVRKLSDESVSVGDRKFTLDAVLDSKSSQDNAYQAVGVSMVKSAMAGYNTSILAYGQTGSGKTYTLWDPPSAMVEDQSASGNQGIVPRIFQMLFSEIQQVQDQAEGKQINYQCRCSFLEIYNEQIGDLLDPTQRNLEVDITFLFFGVLHVTQFLYFVYSLFVVVMEQSKSMQIKGFYVENLSEEYVTGYEDVTQILIKVSCKMLAESVSGKESL